MNVLSDLPDFDYHDSVISALSHQDGELTMFLECVREGTYSAEKGHETDHIALVDVKFVFRGVGNTEVDGHACARIDLRSETDGAEVMEFVSLNNMATLVLLWTTYAPLATSYQKIGFTWINMIWEKLGPSKDPSC